MTPGQLEKLQKFRSNVIQYKKVETVLNALEDLHESGQHLEAACSLVVGPSGSGKTTTLRSYADRFPPVSESERDRLPILLVEAPARATPKGLAEVMLSALGDPAPSKGTLQSMTRRVEGLLRARGVELVMLDEFQHLIDRQKSTNLVAYDAADWIKGLLNTQICPVVLSGTELAIKVIEANEQLQRRCMSVISLDALPFGTREECAYFQGILEAFDTVLPFERPSDLSKLELAARIHAATGGLIGRVASLLTSASRYAMKQGLPCLDQTVLGDAWAGSATPSSGNNPFRTPHPQAAAAVPQRDTSRAKRCRGTRSEARPDGGLRP